jgi:hypothetical protein
MREQGTVRCYDASASRMLRGKLVGISLTLTTVALLLITAPAYSQNLTSSVICAILKTESAKLYAKSHPASLSIWKLGFNTIDGQIVTMAIGDNENYKVVNVPMRMTEEKFFWHFPVDDKNVTFTLDRTTLVMSIIFAKQGNAEYPLYQCRQRRL